MNKKPNIFLSLLFLTIVCCLSSCAKKEAAETPFTKIQGKWKKTRYANDDNNNGKIEAWEIHPVEGNINNELLFKNTSTGVESNPGTPDLAFSWAISKDSVILQYAAHFRITYYIRDISSQDLTLTANTALGVAWYYYIKE